MNRISQIAIVVVVAMVPGIAHAHLGHVGELAGHAHVIGIGALVAAAAIAALLMRPEKDDEAQDDEAEDAELETA